MPALPDLTPGVTRRCPEAAVLATGAADTASFADRLIAWQHAHGRHDLPWQRTRDPYRIWLSEIMLQQTQVATVIPYYQRFTQAFPDVDSLAAAPLERVLERWSGLGYYRRARHLHAAARAVVAVHGGVFPTDAATLETLPGVGRSTAAAIAVFAAGERAAILDGNVKRVLCRHDAVAGDPGSTAVLARLWALAVARLPASGLEAYTQGLMDLGATVCTRSRPACGVCPLADSCAARALGDPAAYPGRRPRRSVPLREIAPLLVVEPGGRVLLERRPEVGIWAGLWGLPECPRAPASPDDALAHARRLLGEGLRIAAAPRADAPFDHALTHFRLRITVWRIALAAPAPMPDTTGWRWLAPAEAGGAALPRPVRALLLAPGQPATD